MDADEKLVQSSARTRDWLTTLRKRLPQFDYSEARYYAALRSGPSHPAFAYLNPAKGSIRPFLPLDPGVDGHLRPTPCTSRWAVRFPSVFSIAGEDDLSTATDLILRSFAIVPSSTHKNVVRRPE